MERNSKGYRIGESHHNAKLSSEQVAMIRQLRRKGLLYREIAERIGCGLTTVKKIVNNEIRNEAQAQVDVALSYEPLSYEPLPDDHSLFPWSFQDRLKEAARIPDAEKRIEAIDSVVARLVQTCPKHFVMGRRS